MDTSKFKTTIKCSGCVAKVTPFLDNALGKDNWEVDTGSPSKVLTVVGETDERKVIHAVEKAGYKAEKLSRCPGGNSDTSVRANCRLSIIAWLCGCYEPKMEFYKTAPVKYKSLLRQTRIFEVLNAAIQDHIDFKFSASGSGLVQQLHNWDSCLCRRSPEHRFSRES